MDVSIGSIKSQGGAFSLFGKATVANGDGTVHRTGGSGKASSTWTSVDVVGGAVSFNGTFLEIHGDDGRGYVDDTPVTAGRYMKVAGKLYRQDTTDDPADKSSWVQVAR